MSKRPGVRMLVPCGPSGLRMVSESYRDEKTPRENYWLAGILRCLLAMKAQHHLGRIWPLGWLVAAKTRMR